MKSNPPLVTIILAAGEGTRMLSTCSKVLHKVGNKSLLEHVAETAQHFSEKIFVVYGHQGEQVQSTLSHLSVNWVHQKEQKGTGHAVQQVLPYLNEEEQVLILMGDCPLIRPETLKAFIQSTSYSRRDLALLCAHLPNPFGYGRLIRNKQGELERIIEEKDASLEQKLIQEINTGIYLISVRLLNIYLPQLTSANQQAELLLTDLFQKAICDQHLAHTFEIQDTQEILGVNDKIQLAQVEQFYQQRKTYELMQLGVTLLDPTSIKIRGDIKTARDVEIDVGVILEGSVKIGAGCRIGAYSILKNVELGEGVVVHPYTHIEDAHIEAQAEIGPYARIRPGSHICASAKVGNFVELKKTQLGPGSKANHLAYLGDAVIGKKVTIGAGTITCNYDGINKHNTWIKDDAFIGSDTQLVAPVTIHEGATIGAGSTITKDAPAHQLTLSRTAQMTNTKWKRPTNKLSEDKHE